MRKLKIWLKTIRASFFTADLVPVVVGTSLAFFHTGEVNLFNALLCLIALILFNTAVNLLNDYGDHLSKNDEFNKNFNRFSGGSRSIQNKEVKPRNVLIIGIISLILGSTIGLYLNYISRGNIILIFGLIGAFTVLFYTLSPLRIGYRGIGEIITGLDLGILAVMGTFYLQTNQITLSSFLAGIPVALLITSVLYINEYPDYEADRKADKKTLVVILDKKRARIGFFILITGTFVSILLSIFLGPFEYITLICLLTLPIAVRVLYHFNKNYDKYPDIIPANAGTIQLHLFTGLLLGISFILSRYI